MKKLFFIIFLCFLIFPLGIINAQAEDTQADEFFTARVMQVLEQKQVERQDGSKVTQQNIKLKGLDGSFEGKDIYFNGIGELDVVSSTVYDEGDKVHVLASYDFNGQATFYITDYVRSSYLIWLIILLFTIVAIVSRWKGFKALISLALTFVVILQFIIPLILRGWNPLIVTVLGSIFILLIIIYLTEGFNQESHVSVFSISIALFLTGLLSILFTSFAKLSGGAQEEIMYLIGLGQGSIDFHGLLLAGIIIGTLGAIDDGVVSQVSAIKQLKIANPELKGLDLYKRAMEIGNSHIGSMINTLFLAYAGASLPLLMIFSVNIEPFVSVSQILNNEMIATEIIRAFVGSIGLAMAIPISTLLAVKFIKTNKKN